jgi:hypothetical protein
MLDFLLFRKMIAPILLQILFWPAVAASLYYSWQLVRGGYMVGWIPLIVGTVFVRVVFELGLLLFRIYERLGAIQRALETPRREAEPS